MSEHTREFRQLNLLHILNDGYQASIALILPFVAVELGLALAQVVALSSFQSAVGILMVVPAGWLAKRFGGAKTLVMAMVMCSLVFVGLSQAPMYAMLALLFGLAGMSLGVFHPIAFALVSDWSTKSNRGRMMSDFAAWGDVGRIGLSTALPMLAVAIGWRFATLWYGVVGVTIALALSWLLLKSGSATVKSKAAGQVSLRDVVSHPRTFVAMVASFFDVMASNSMYLFLPFLLVFRGIELQTLGFFTAVFFIGNLLGKVVLGRLVDKRGSAKVFVISEIIMVALILVLAISTNIASILGAALILGIFAKGTTPIVQTMLAESAEHHGDYVKVFSVNTIITRVVAVAVPVAFGALADQFDIRWAFYAMAVAAACAVVPGVAFMATKQRVS